MLSVASLPIGAPGPTLHWRNTDMEQVIFMLMVIIFMMMMWWYLISKMKVMMPQLAQNIHGASELGDGGDYLHGDNGDNLLVMIVMTLHLHSEQVIFVIFIMLTMVTMVTLVIMLVVVAGCKRSWCSWIHVTYSSQPEKLRYYINFHKLDFIVETTEKQNYNIPNFTPRSVLILHNIPFLSACWELLPIFMVKSKSFAWHTAINLKVQHFVTRSLNPFIRIL